MAIDIREIREDHSLYEEALDLRYKLFFEEHGLPKSVTADDLESVSDHCVVLADGAFVAYGRLSPLGSGTYRISQIVVPEEHRRNGYATMLINKLIEMAARRNGKSIQLNAQTAVTNLYSSIGFQPFGDPYSVKLTGVEHVKMVYEINM